ncbi:MAG TPA: DUF456 domain-containing protein [Micromonosporaceae bacterium]|nr:DUF456 domain-containing protein [Micromonosporaceae bacterium]
MELTDFNATITLVAGLAIVVGVCGVIVPILPGLLLCWAGVLLWAIFAEGGVGKWVVFGIATLLALGGTVIKYAWPGRNLKRTGVPNRSLFLGGLLAIVGFFVIPVVGLVIGFVLGILLAERVRLNDNRAAWTSTKHALKAAGLSMLIELGAALAIAATWVAGLLTLG